MRSTVPLLLVAVTSLLTAEGAQTGSPPKKHTYSPTAKHPSKTPVTAAAATHHRYSHGTYKKINALRTARVTARVRRPVAPIVSPALRAAAYTVVSEHMNSEPNRFESAAALQPFFDRLSQSIHARAETSQPDADQAASDHADIDQAIHILQFGDSHTASDDWVESMRTIFQSRYGDGGPGFTMAGHPFRGYRRFDIRGMSSPGWVTEGTVGHAGDDRNGLSGVSMTASRPGETLSVTTSGDVLELYYLRQPGGGSFTLEEDGMQVETINSNGDMTTAVYTVHPTPGEHTYNVRTLSYAPVRLFGWVSENLKGVTWETLGINGEQASMLLNWDPVLWTQQIRLRNPALVLIAYGTNEALSPSWTAEDYRASLLRLIAQFRQAVPNAALLLVGPPDCGRLHAFPHLGEVIEIQRQVAEQTGVAFWDWRHHMGGPGATHMWVRAGLSQADYTHLTGDGYKLLGQTLADEIDLAYRRYLNQPVAAAPAVRDAGFVQ
ncbi:MAG TPA: GDSL-type esterase/lipase family protein [Bryobacteraceae bacterium]|nr:GDSL-type esterase/lipase family protein [Bryobacteraceae bacterium]